MPSPQPAPDIQPSDGMAAAAANPSESDPPTPDADLPALDADEVQAWLARDPIARLEAYLRSKSLLDDAGVAAIADEAARLAADVRMTMNIDVTVDPAELFEHVYARPTAALERQRAALLDELKLEVEAGR